MDGSLIANRMPAATRTMRASAGVRYGLFSESFREFFRSTKDQRSGKIFGRFRAATLDNPWQPLATVDVPRQRITVHFCASRKFECPPNFHNSISTTKNQLSAFRDDPGFHRRNKCRRTVDRRAAECCDYQWT